MSIKHIGVYLVTLGLIFSVSNSVAQNKKVYPKSEWYLSWGYNTEWYTRSNVHISQPELGNDYTFNRIKGHDKKGWDNGLFRKAISIPQYNYRLGYFFNPRKGWGVEINFDHTKFIFEEGQDASITGTLHGKHADTTVRFSKDDGFYYYLNNGANFLLFNLVKRCELLSTKDVENSFFGDANTPHFQLGGWNMGVEATVKATFFKYAFIEYANKLDYARYSNLKIYKGTAKHAFGTYEMILSMGVSLPVGKRAAL